MTDFHAPISEQIWSEKYRFEDEHLIGTRDRIARALAAPESDAEHWGTQFYQALDGFRFLPAGRIISGAGTGRNVTLFNCFVMGTIPDSMDGIFTMLREAALTMQQGGGIGYDFSTLRPKGAPVKGVAADASGPLSFMDVWDAMCRTIMSAGSRRGAMMATMRCDHPDILDFIEAKRDAARLRMFNLSVLVTDEFMRAVERGREWALQFGYEPCQRALPARELWDRIMRATYDVAEPGVIFIDRINEQNNLRYCETISATNPCGEEPLPPYGACLLGSINLAALVRDPFTSAAHLKMDELRSLVGTAVRMLDNVVDVSRFPLESQAIEAREKRRIGLGVTGLADALAMCEHRYGTEQAAMRAEGWLRTIRDAAYAASVDLAKEKGSFPLFDADEYLADGTFASTLPRGVKAAIREHGIRNSHLLSIAPTGTISLFAGNVSSGIEPIFAHSYTRKVLQKDDTKREEVVEDFAVAKWRELHGDEPLPDYFVTTADLSPLDHVRMQAVAQRYVDSSISKTINVPAGIDFDAFKGVYLEAYRQGCKGCTTYRPNEVTGSVLSAPDVPKLVTDPKLLEKLKEAVKEEGPGPIEFVRPASKENLVDRPEQLVGTTYKLKWPESPHAVYITINDIVEDGARRPFEIFINSKNMEHYAWTVALTRMVSAIFRRGGNVGFVAEELKQVFDPRGGGWVKGEYVPSILAAIGEVVERHLKGLQGEPVPATEAHPTEAVRVPSPTTCPRCGSYRLTMEGGCEVCKDCGHSKCG